MNFWDTVITDVEAGWGAITTEVEADALIAWGAIKTIFLTLLPKQWTILKGLFQTALVHVQNGDFADLESSILNQAEAQELAWISELGTDVLVAIVAVLKTLEPAGAQ